MKTMVATDSTGGSSPCGVQLTLDVDILVRTTQVCERLEEAIGQEGEEIVAYAIIRSRDGSEFGLEGFEERRLDLDQIVAVGLWTAFVGTGTSTE